MVCARLLIGLLGLLLATGAAGGERIVLAVGDSITADPEGIPSFAERLAIPGTRLVNVACPGASSADWLRRPASADAPCFRGAADRLEPWRGRAAVVLVLIGSNDSYGFDEPEATPPDAYRRNLEQLVARFEAPVILSVPPPNAVALPMLERYREEIARVVAAHDHVHRGVDFLAELSPERLRDGVHPDAEGHARMADLLRPRVVELLAAPR